MKKLFLFLAIVLIASFVISCNANEAIYLTAGEKGEYGKLMTYNEGTEFEETLYVYYVPSGTYNVTNVCKKGHMHTQVSVYSDKTVITEDGWEEPADGKAYLIKEGETVEIVIPEGWYIEIHEPTYILMKKKKD